VSSLINPQPPHNERELLERCSNLEGLSFAQLGTLLSQQMPIEPNKRKGWIGQLLEIALGATASNKAAPDFEMLGIELKTLPIGKSGRPTESTYVTSIPLLTIYKEQWQQSQCYRKLKHVLWILIEDDDSIPYAQRRIGEARLWSPSKEQELELADDWSYLSLLIAQGQLESIDSTAGRHLQIRPKAANGKSLCPYFDENGNRIMTLPRGFYLRASFTALLL
jgi:DNA mismatch repair protein MutH